MEIICIFLLSDLKCHSCLPNGPQHARARAPGQWEYMPSEMLGRWLLLKLTEDFNGAEFNAIHLKLCIHSFPLWDKNTVTFVDLCNVLLSRGGVCTPTAGLACPRTRNLYSSPSFSAAVKFNSIAYHMTDFIFFYRFEWVFKGWIGRVPHKKNKELKSLINVNGKELDCLNSHWSRQGSPLFCPCNNTFSEILSQVFAVYRLYCPWHSQRDILILICHTLSAAFLFF